MNQLLQVNCLILTNTQEMLKSMSTFKALIFASVWLCSLHVLAEVEHPRLVVTAQDIVVMKDAIKQQGRFKNKFEATLKAVNAQLLQPFNVPVPADSGGGYTHEQHKKNYQLMYDAGIIYQLTKDARYRDYVRDMLLAYAKLYPNLPLHPKRKVGKQNPGKLFWQSLNEAVWLVHTIQAYDFVIDSLNTKERHIIENQLFRPMVKFLSVDSPLTFNKVHNHGTWTTAAVGMTGYVLDELDWVEQALYGLDKSGKGGFIRQLDELFSPQGYYNEGPYYQRYALMPFVTFAKSIESNQPERKIFQYRDNIILKAIDTTIQLSYNQLFFPLNDAIKDKGIDTIELVNGVTIAYGLTGNFGLLDIAKQQNQVLLTGDGLKVAKALDDNLVESYEFRSVAFGDGKNGKQGALVVMRSNNNGEQTVLFKPAAQGLGHGHFDKLSWQFYDKKEEIVSDYGAARFLNVEAKFGGRYLPENNSWAKQTIAHNTVVVDEKSHFDGQTSVGNKHAPQLLYFENTQQIKIASASINTAYKNVTLKRTLALVQLPKFAQGLVIDVFDVQSESEHQYDLPLHYKGHLINTNFSLNPALTNLSTLGEYNGFQHLWVKAQAQPKAGLNQITWLNENGRFYTHSTIMDGDSSLIFTQLGANDPNFNLRNESAFINRKKAAKSHRFVSVLEPHGEYNPSKEFTNSAVSQIQNLSYVNNNDIGIIEIILTDNNRFLFAFNTVKTISKQQINTFLFNGVKYQFSGQSALFDIKP